MRGEGGGGTGRVNLGFSEAQGRGRKFKVAFEPRGIHTNANNQ